MRVNSVKEVEEVKAVNWVKKVKRRVKEGERRVKKVGENMLVLPCLILLLSGKVLDSNKMMFTESA